VGGRETDDAVGRGKERERKRSIERRERKEFKRSIAHGEEHAEKTAPVRKSCHARARHTREMYLSVYGIYCQ